MTWQQQAGPFLKGLVDHLALDIPADPATLVEKLKSVGKTPESFLAESAYALLARATGNPWIIQLYGPELMKQAEARAGDLAAAFGGVENAIIALAQQDLTAISEALIQKSPGP